MVRTAWEEAQASVIGSLLIDPEHVAGIVMDRLSPADFSGEWATLFAAARAVWARREPIDPVTVCHEAGSAYEPAAREAMQLTPTAANAALYARICRDEAALQRLRDGGARLLAAADLPEARSVLTELEPTLVDRPEVRVVSFEAGMIDWWSRMQDTKKPEYIDWGMAKANEKLFVEPGDFVILGGDPSSGKTVLGLQFACGIAARGSPTGFFSLETSDWKIFDRVAARLGHVPLSAIKGRSMTPEHWENAVGLGKIKMPMDVIPSAGMGVEDVRAVTVAHGYRVIVIDYLQLLKDPGKGRVEQVTNISLGLHTMAQALGVTVIALSQLTRPEGQDRKKIRRATLRDLRESGQIEQDADCVMLLNLDDDKAYGPDEVRDRWLDIVKNKEGELGSIALRFDPEHMEFTPTDTRRRKPEWKQKKPAQQSIWEETMEAVPF